MGYSIFPLLLYRKMNDMKEENWIEITKPPKPNTQCKAKTPGGIDNVGEAWFDGKKWWYWEEGSTVKFGLKDGWVTHYIPIRERVE